MKYCLIIPHFNHADEFAAFLPALVSLNLPCIVVDDGSDVASRKRVQELIASQEQFYFFQHGYNCGKGAAVMTACQHAQQLGFTHAVQIDADGQHDIADVPTFIQHSQDMPAAIISGHPQFDESAPKARVYGRKVTDFWVSLETLSFTIKDSLCGFRVYPIQSLERIADRFHLVKNMGFDTDILVKWVWAGLPVAFIPTQVIYPENSVSHFHYWRDNLILIRLHTRLMFGMLLRSPLLVSRKLKRALFANH